MTPTTPEARERGRRGLRRARRLADSARLAMTALLRPLADLGRFPVRGPGPARRLVLVQLDGVSRARLELAMAEGYMPYLAARLASGRHLLTTTRSGAPASTPAFQAGLFYGVSPALPGFVWFDRPTGREVRMDRADDAAAVEARLSRRGPGLLRGGTSYFSVFSGAAAVPHFCLSGLSGDLDLEWYGRNLGGWDAVASVLVHSLTALRGAFRIGHEVGVGVVDGLRWSLAVGRSQHEWRFLAHRVLIGALVREFAVQTIAVDISRGIPAVYVDLMGYDETAHRRGPGSAAAMRHLAAADAAIATILGAADSAPEMRYDVFVLSDHGHVATCPFERLAGVPLPEFVACAERGDPLPPLHGNGHGFAGRSLRGGRYGGIATAEAGDLAHVYFLRDRAPLPLEALRVRHGRVLATLSACPAVGILGARGGRRGFAILRGDVLDLAEPRDVARLPHPEPALAATYLADLLSLPDSGDLVVLGWRGAGREVVAYAWEFGSHGGVAPEELQCFVAHPASCEFPFADAVRPAELNRFFERTYRADEAPPREAPEAASSGGGGRGAEARP